MDNYKILNTKTNAIIKLLNELGYAWVPTTNDSEASLLKAHWIIAESSGDIAYSSTETFYEQDSYKELSFNQLSDLVVLKRNDVRDATHKNFRTNTPYLKQGENEYYMFNGEWVLSNCPNDLEPINKPHDPALISGREAWLAFFDGLHVQWSEIDREAWFNFKEEDWNTHSLKNDGFIFRLKPQTIKLNDVEVPAPIKTGVESDSGVLVLFKNNEDRDKFLKAMGY
ncbi:hypothetical protein NQ624_08470 [Acinetobacter baumannii]|nr:hypothetical protein [Acinetobacter baumannii]